MIDDEFMDKDKLLEAISESEPVILRWKTRESIEITIRAPEGFSERISRIEIDMFEDVHPEGCE